MSIKKDVKQHYFGKYTKDYEVLEYTPRSPNSAASFEVLAGHTLEQIRSMSDRIMNLIKRGKVDDPHHYQYFKSAAKLYSVESMLTTVATAKLIVVPKITGIGIALYYMWNPNQKIYTFHKAKLEDPSAVKYLPKEMLDVTDKVKELVNLYANVDHRTIPSYIHAATFEEHGVSLVREGQENPKFLCVQTVLTVPVLDTLESDLYIDQLARGWLNSPKEMIKESRPKFHFVAYNLKANTGFLAAEPLEFRGTAGSNRKVFTMTRRGIINTLGCAGFHTIIQSTDTDKLVRGMVMGIEHSCLETYIVPALQSIRETNKRVNNLKTEKAIAAFKKSTLNRNDDLINIFNYLRHYPYNVEGLMIHPNYHIVYKALENAINTSLYLTPASVSKLPDTSSLELMKILNVSFEDAKRIKEITGYDGTRNPLTKVNIRLLAKSGINITQDQVVAFQNNIDNVHIIRERTEPTRLVKAQDQLWELNLK